MTSDAMQPATFDPNADLMGDWSWKPDRYPKDPGYTYTAQDLRVFEAVRAANDNGVRVSMMRPWSFPAYNAADLAFKPVRIGPRT